MNSETVAICPVCGLTLPQSEIELHAALHFAEDEPLAAQHARPETEVIDIDDDGEDDAQTVQCPYGCGALLALHELDSHEEAHRLQEVEAKQIELERQQADKEHELLQMQFGFSDKRPGKCFHCGQEGHWSRECPRKGGTQPRPQQQLPLIPARLVQLQQPDSNADLHSVDVIPLLHACFDAQPKAHSTVYLSGSVGFHSGKGQADCGWGCGYRNIQMQVSHQLMKGDAAVRQALFGGCNFVPSVASLQAWLEVAWAAGFDPGGAAMFGSQVQSTRKWIGTTEAAALLRYFGCRALLVEFLGKPAATSVTASGATVHTGVQCDICHQTPITGIRYKSYQTPNYDLCSKCRESPEAEQHAPFRSFGSQGAAAAAANTVSGSNASRRGTSPAAAAISNVQQQPDIRQFMTGSSSGSQQTRQQQHSGAVGADGSLRGAAAAGGQASTDKPDAERHRRLAEWIWTYFSTGAAVPAQQTVEQPPGWLSMENPTAAAADAACGGVLPVKAATGGSSSSKVPRRNSPVVLTGKPPLYLQHEGHSRTVIGIERCLSPQAEARGGIAAAEYCLIVLDPGIAAQELLTSLRSQQGWQKRVKRGLGSLALKAEYQVLHIAPGLVPEGPARESLKKISAQDRFSG